MHKDPGVAILSVTAPRSAVSGHSLGLPTASSNVVKAFYLSLGPSQACLSDSFTFWECGWKVGNAWLDGKAERNTFHIVYPNSSGRSRKMTDKSRAIAIQRLPRDTFSVVWATAHDNRAGIVSQDIQGMKKRALKISASMADSPFYLKHVKEQGPTFFTPKPSKSRTLQWQMC